MAHKTIVIQDCFTFLVRAKYTVESLLASDHCNVWSMHGGLKRLSDNLQDIFQHNLKVEDGNFWPVIQQLCTTSLSAVNVGKPHGSKIHLQDCPYRVWIETALYQHRMTASLDELSSHRSDLGQYYKAGAYVLNEPCVAALRKCLEAVEKSDPSVLADVNLAKMKKELFGVRHLSLPNIFLHDVDAGQSTSSQVVTKDTVYNNSSNRILRRTCSDIGSIVGNIRDFYGIDHTIGEFSEDSNTTSSNTRRRERRQRKTSTFTSPYDLLGSSSLPCFQEKNVIVEEEDVEDNSATHTNTNRSISRPTYIKTYDDFVDNQSNDSVTNLQHSSLSNEHQFVMSMSPSTLTDFIYENSTALPNSLREQSVNETDSLNDNLAIDTTHTLIDPLNCDSPSQQIHHENMTLAKITSKKNVDNNQSKSHELTRIGVSDDQNNNSIGQKRKVIRSLSSSDETNLDDIFLTSNTTDYNKDTAPSLDDIWQYEDDYVLIKKSIMNEIDVSGTCSRYSSNTSYQDAGSLSPTNTNHHQSTETAQQLSNQSNSKTARLCSLPIDKEVKSEDLIKSIMMSADVCITDELERENAHLTLAEDILTFVEVTRCEMILDNFDDYEDDKASNNALSRSDKIDQVEADDLDESGLTLKIADRRRQYECFQQSINTVSKRSNISENDHSSAGYLAKSLLTYVINKCSGQPADDNPMLISDAEVPQDLLPEPKSPDQSIASSSFEESMEQSNPRIRGNLEWAPPRNQIIFIIHPQSKRKAILARSNYRCTGCGMKVDKGYSKRFRYCDYFGKYFCQTCHTNATAVIPARVIQNWDFSKYAVSRIADELLTKMRYDPLFNVLDCNQSLYNKIKVLNSMKELRIQLFYLMNYITTCRLAKALSERLDKLPLHLMNQPHMYSMQDFVDTKNKSLLNNLQSLVTACVTHVLSCQFCSNRGFICEICRSERPLFPFETLTAYQCSGCYSCYHKKCFDTVPNCPKCERLKRRKQQSASSE